jgi:transposase
VRKKLPHARIVVDRFHVMKQLNDKVTKIRRRMQNNGNEEIRELLKGSRWLLVRNRKDLSSKEEQHLQKILDLCEELRAVYLLKEEFRQIFEIMDSRERAERFLSAWKLKALYTCNKYIGNFVRTLTTWWSEILNYFLEGITNGYVEGLNGALRNIIHRAFGYRNFDNFELQVFAEQGYHSK